MHPLQQKIYDMVRLRGLRRFQSLRELGDAIGEQHPQKIKHHLLQLQKDGLVKIDWEKYTIESRLDERRWHDGEILSVPILGSANCGAPTLIAEERPEGVLMVSRKIVRAPTKRIFALRAVGNSMNQAKFRGNENIDDGDFVVIDPEDRNAENGDYVLSIINGSANIKRFYSDVQNHRVILYSESNEIFPPIMIHVEDNPDFFINGKVVAVVKNPQIPLNKPEYFRATGN
jgi:SOS-response transcriptional repressor LexA